MPRFSNTKDTLIEFNNMNLQADTRYRESGLVLWPEAVVNPGNLNVCYVDIIY